MLAPDSPGQFEAWKHSLQFINYRKELLLTFPLWDLNFK